MSLSVATVTAAKIAADFEQNEQLSSFSLVEGRGRPGVITRAVEDEMGDIWVEWEDGNGEHTRCVSADELLAALHAQVAQHDTSLFDVGSSPRHKAAPAIEDIEVGLVESGARRTLARILAADASADLADWAAAGLAAGMSKVRIAHLAGLTRPGLDHILG